MKLIIFDLDGVLLESRDIHYRSLNQALKLYNIEISYEEHLSTYDGLSTTMKLELLTKNKGLDPRLYDQIWKSKQYYTTQCYLNDIHISYEIIDLFENLNKLGYKIAVASNSIRKTMTIALERMGIITAIDFFVGNDEIKHPKPYPEMYWKCMRFFKALPKDTIIVEDSHIGREAVLNSGANLFSVESTKDFIARHDELMVYAKAFRDNTLSIPWKSSKLNVLIPMAGAGTRFQAAGYTFPKPLIEVHGKPMIQVVVESLNIDANYIFLVQREHYEKYNLKYMLNLLKPGCEIVLVDGLTEGAACTTLLAKELINNGNPLIMANSDQYIEWSSNNVMYAFSAEGVDGGILTFKAAHPKWSYARLDGDGFVAEVAEKKVISEHATVGVYYWKHGSDYVKYAEQMIAKNIRVNGEFYVCPVFNEAIADQKKFRIKEIETMYGIGAPEDLNYFLSLAR